MLLIVLDALLGLPDPKARTTSKICRIRIEYMYDIISIYINNMHNIGLQGDLTLYADDACLFYFTNSIQTLLTAAQADLNILNVWLQYILLTINISKPNYSIFSVKIKKEHTIYLRCMMCKVK